MLGRDIKGIYLPTAYVMLGLSNLIVCQCAAEPIPPNVTGPSGSTMICFFYYLFHLILWIPVGIVLVLLQWFRYRRPTTISTKASYLVSSNDNVRHVVGALIGGFLVVVSSVILGDPAGAFSVFVASSIINIVPAFIFFGIGALVTMPKRTSIKEKEVTS